MYIGVNQELTEKAKAEFLAANPSSGKRTSSQAGLSEKKAKRAKTSGEGGEAKRTNSGLNKPSALSLELARVVGTKVLPRPQVRYIEIEI